MDFRVNNRRNLFVAAFSLLLAVAALQRPLHAGPPFVTDDPEPVDFKHWEFYLAGTYAHERDGDAAAAPMVEVNYGALPELQLHIVAPFLYDAPDGEISHFGFGDLELGAKYRFVQETEKIPQVGFFPLVEIPTGDEKRGLGNGKAQVFLPIWIQKSFGPWTTYGGGGWWYNPGDGNKDFWRVGWLIQRDITENLTLGGEMFLNTADSDDAEDEVGFNLGGIYNLNDNMHFLFSAGRDLQGPSLFQCYVGFQLTL
jgi:Putative MetA-pathway of phenol degradation